MVSSRGKGNRPRSIPFKEETMSQSIIVSGRPVRNINEDFGDPVVSLSLEAFEAEIEELGYMPEDGLQEGRDYEYVTAEEEDLLVYASIPHIYMFPETGSTDTEAGWRESCADNGEEFRDEDFVEVCSMNPPALLGKSLSDNYLTGGWTSAGSPMSWTPKSARECMTSRRGSTRKGWDG